MILARVVGTVVATRKDPRLEGKKLLDAEWVMSDTMRRVKSYRLTAAGRRHLLRETEGWLQYARAVQLILKAT